MSLQSLEYYQALPWARMVTPSDDILEPWTARIVELPGCMSHGSSPVEALTGLDEALQAYIEGAQAVGNPIPEPLSAGQFKGIITYRTKPEKHCQLAKAAQVRGISVNRLIDDALDHLLAG